MRVRSIFRASIGAVTMGEARARGEDRAGSG